MQIMYIPICTVLSSYTSVWLSSQPGQLGLRCHRLGITLVSKVMSFKHSIDQYVPSALQEGSTYASQSRLFVQQHGEGR